jgi:hypothetical protein
MAYPLTVFNDLPDIQFPEDACLTSQNWHFQDEFGYNMMDRSMYNPRDLSLADLHLQMESGNCNLPPMDRFRSDPGPFSSGMAVTDLKVKDLHVHSPEVSYRQYSPDGTENSSIGCDTFSACHSDDLHQFSQGHRGSIGASPDLHQGYFPQSQYSSYSPQSHGVSLCGGSSISLSQIQQFEDVDAGYEHSHSEIDADGDSDHEHDHIVCRPPRVKPYTHSEDEGLGESIQDSDSVTYRSRSEVDEDEEADPEYKPRSTSSQRSSRPRRSSGARQSNGRKLSNASASGRVSKPKTKKTPNPSAARPFPCPLTGYGCPSTFTSKNEWKRHVSTQHIKLGFWRCDMCSPSSDPVNPVYNDFNRKDLFTQHLRRMHVQHQYSIEASQNSTPSTSSPKSGDSGLSDEAVLAHQQRCYRQLRAPPPRSSCLFCPRSFSGDGTWEERMEHVGAHFERERKSGNKFTGPESWRTDPHLQDYLVQEGLIEHDAQAGWHIGDGRPLR